MTQLNELAARVEGAGADEQSLILRDAFRAIHGNKPERVHGGSQELTDWLNLYNPFFHMVNVGAFESAAMTLVPDGYDFGCGSSDCTGKAWAWSGMREAPRSIQWNSMYCCNAATPALALVAAALRSRDDLRVKGEGL